MSEIHSRKNIDLHTSSVKNTILEYLFKMKGYDSDTHLTIDNMDHVNYISKNDYTVCPRVRGTRSWVLFFKNNDHHYAVNFPKQNVRKRDTLNIYPVDIQMRSTAYLGTIMEGIYYKVGNIRHLLIDEVYTLAGHNQMLKSKGDRLSGLAVYLKINKINSPTFTMNVTNHYSLNKTSLLELYEKLKIDGLNYTQELIFYPNLFGKQIYSYTLLDTDLIDDVCETSIFSMTKTSKPDVYRLINAETLNKIGIAYIPDIQTSKRCKNFFKDNRKKQLLVECVMDKIHHKWIPMRVVSETKSI